MSGSLCIFLYWQKCTHLNFLLDILNPFVFASSVILLMHCGVVVVMVSIRPPAIESSSPFHNPLVTVPRAPITTGIIHVPQLLFFTSLARSRYLSFFSFSFKFILWSAVWRGMLSREGKGDQFPYHTVFESTGQSSLHSMTNNRLNREGNVGHSSSTYRFH